MWLGYDSPGNDNDATSVQWRRFGSDTLPLDNDFQVNTYTTNWQNDAVVAAAGDGSFVVAWESGLFGLTHSFPISAIFADGFESGNTGEWSSTMGGP